MKIFYLKFGNRYFDIKYGIDTAAKATQAFHVAFTAAISAGTLKMILTPTSYTNETEITLTQNELQ